MFLITTLYKIIIYKTKQNSFGVLYGYKKSLLIYNLQFEDWINTYYMQNGFLKHTGHPKCQMKWNVQMERWYEQPRIRTWAYMRPMLMWITPYVAKELLSAHLTPQPPHHELHHFASSGDPPPPYTLLYNHTKIVSFSYAIHALHM